MKIIIYCDSFGLHTTTFIYYEALALAEKNDLLFITLKHSNEQKFPFLNLKILDYKINRFIKKLRWWLEINDIKLIFKIESLVEKFGKLYWNLIPI